MEPGGEVTGVHHSLDHLLRSILGGGCQQLTARVLYLSGLPESDLAFSCGTLPGLTTSGKKLSMSKYCNLSLLHWTTPVGGLLNFLLLGLPFKNPVHPPPSTVPTSENPGPSYHPGTPLSTIICLTGKQLFGLSAPHPLADHSINPVRLNYYSLVLTLSIPCLPSCLFLQLVSRFQFPCPHHYTVNKIFTVKLCLLNCFLHVGQIH
ncbi:hypothetical protein ILYODFUR_030641 [Ilyodon furcidens]|uniref:Uncharacterized protein n=1 Tax=Ilyodon furcidens TaxID=33524 RepID=A0ABV0TZ30_9TELE